MTNRVSLSFSQVSVSDNDGRRIVQPVGELDVVTRDELVSAGQPARYLDMLRDLEKVDDRP
jgi:hypothetical protein